MLVLMLANISDGQLRGAFLARRMGWSNVSAA